MQSSTVCSTGSCHVENEEESGAQWRVVGMCVCVCGGGGVPGTLREKKRVVDRVKAARRHGGKRAQNAPLTHYLPVTKEESPVLRATLAGVEACDLEEATPRWSTVCAIEERRLDVSMRSSSEAKVLAQRLTETRDNRLFSRRNLPACSGDGTRVASIKRSS